MAVDEQAYPLCGNFSAGCSNMAVPLQPVYTGYFNGKFRDDHGVSRRIHCWSLRLVNYCPSADSQPAKMKPRQFMVHRPDIPHFTRIPTDTITGYYWIYFTGNFVEQLLADCKLVPDRIYTLSEAGMKTVQDDFQLFFRECAQKKSGYEHICTASLMNILVHLSRGCQNAQDPQHDTVFRRLEKTLLYAQSNFSDSSLTTAKLAERAQLSVSRYRELFRNYTGMPPSEYIIKLRIDHACSLLQNTALTVSQISNFCGYPDIAYFSRLFRKKTGLSPTEYRQRHTAP